MLEWNIWGYLDFIAYALFQIELMNLCLNYVEFSLNLSIQTKFKKS